MTRKTRRAKPPDGIGPAHQEPHRGLARHASPASIVVLGALVVFGLSGLAGSRSTANDVANAAVELTVRAPGIVRNGEILETVIDVRARRRIGKLVVGVEEGLWREVTINSTVPTAAEESFEDGLFRFTFAAVEPGRSFVFKIDQQVNPALGGRNRGKVVVFDDKDRLAELALELMVLP
jgi:hypothetical protein